MNTNVKNSAVIRLCIALLMVLAVVAGIAGVGATTASAAVSNKALWTTSDFVVQDSEDGAVLTYSTVQKEQAPSVYFKEEVLADGVVLDFAIETVAFESLEIILVGEDPDFAKAEAKNVITIAAKTATLNGGAEKSIVLEGAHKITWQDGKIFLDSDELGAAEGVYNNVIERVTLKLNNATGSSKILVKSIGGQKLGTSEDPIAPVLLLDEAAMLKFDGTNYLAIAGTQVDIPVILVNPNNNYLVASVWYKKAADTQYTAAGLSSATSAKTKVTLPEAGLYDVQVRVDGYEDSWLNLSINAMEVDQYAESSIPTYDAEAFKAWSEKYFPKNANAGREMKVPAPTFFHDAIDGIGTMQFTLEYRSLSSTVWSSVSGTAKTLGATVYSEGTYVFRMKATNSLNLSSVYSDEFYATFYDNDPPKVSLPTTFPENVTVGKQVTIPNASVSEAVSSATTTITVNFVAEDGTKTEIKLNDSNAFVPTEIGTYEVTYTSTDKHGMTASVTGTFEVVEEVKEAAEFDVRVVILIIVAVVAAAGILVLIFVKPKNKKA